MKKLLLSIACSFLLLGFSHAQKGHKDRVSGNGNVSTEARNVSGFTKIEVSDGVDVYITQGSQNKVEVEADENLIPHVLTEVSGGKLRIHTDRSFYKVNKMRVNVWVKEIEGIMASGGSDVYSQGTISASNLDLKGSGGSDLTMDIKVEQLNCMLSGGSDVDLQGSANNCEMMASGGSDIKAYDLQSSVCRVKVSGGSDAYVSVSSEIDVTASGASDIHYKGNARVVNKRTSGASDIHHE